MKLCLEMGHSEVIGLWEQLTSPSTHKCDNCQGNEKLIPVFRARFMYSPTQVAGGLRLLGALFGEGCVCIGCASKGDRLPSAFLEEGDVYNPIQSEYHSVPHACLLQLHCD